MSLGGGGGGPVIWGVWRSLVGGCEPRIEVFFENAKTKKSGRGDVECVDVIN